MTTKKLTKLLALYLPYILLGLVATNFGEAWRLAEGKELGDKIMAMMGTIPLAFANPLPSLHPLDFAYWLFLRRRVTARRIFAEQKCKEVPSWNGVRLCTMGHRQGY